MLLLALFMFDCLCSSIYRKSLPSPLRSRSCNHQIKSSSSSQSPPSSPSSSWSVLKALAMKIRAEWLHRGSDRCAGISLQYSSLYRLCILYSVMCAFLFLDLCFQGGLYFLSLLVVIECSQARAHMTWKSSHGWRRAQSMHTAQWADRDIYCSHAGWIVSCSQP